MKNLVIVESPTKAKTISKFLGNDYVIRFSMGHIMDLPKSKLGIDVDHDFFPQYELVGDKEQIIKELQAEAAKADKIILATDPDREGEAIAAHIKDLLTRDPKGKKSPKDISAKFSRIVFHEITKEAIQDSVKAPRGIDVHLVEAQTARRVLDRLVGYKISPLLWKKVRRGLSAGRVQSVALRLIVEREREIEKFAKQPYFSVHALLVKEKEQPVEFELVEINDQKLATQEKFVLYDGEYTVTKTTITTKEQVDQILADLGKRAYSVADVSKRETRRSPYAPFTTSTLQQEAARRYGLSGKRTMSLAQKLYEEGVITYHRTDSVTLAPVAITQMRNFILREFGKKYLPDSPRVYAAKQKLAQEAHEGIRPTNVTVQPAEVKKTMGSDYGKLYDLIWRRAVASQMADALIESTSVIVDTQQSSGTRYRFRTNGSVLLFDGFLVINPQALKDNRLPLFEAKELLHLEKCFATDHETLPPPRYNDASLIQALEEKGIGRPSTYASIISTIVDRSYVERVEKRFAPTPIGIAVNDFLVANFSTIDDIPFTASMEDDLDEVASGSKEWVTMMKEFYKPFEKSLETVDGAARVKIEAEKTDQPCPECGAPLVIRYGKFGKFFSCSRFPDCKFTKPYVEETNILCPKDGGKIIIKKTRKGRKFYGCSNYPNCDFAAWKLEDIKGAQAAKTQVAH